MPTLLPPDEFRKCPACQPEMKALTDVVRSMFPDSVTNPAGIARRAADVLILGYYHQGILHQDGHPMSLSTYGMSLKRKQVPVSTLHDCRTCQDEQTWASDRANYFFPGFAANSERVEPGALGYFCRVMYWLGILHRVEHPVALVDYAEAIKTGDFSIAPPPEASDDP